MCVKAIEVSLAPLVVGGTAEALLAQGVPFVLASAYDHHGLEGAAALARVSMLGEKTDERRLLAALAQAVTA